MFHRVYLTGSAAVFALVGGAGYADSISPESFSAELAVGESVTIEKTVEISAAGPSSALIDAYFLFDTSGSMGGAITTAKSASADILAGLNSFGDAAGGVGVYSEAARLPDGGLGAAPGFTINQDISTDTSAGGVIDTAIHDVTLNTPDSGGDRAENGNTAIEQVVENASWRPGSNRFLFVLGDQDFKNSGTDNVDGAPISSDADVMTALNDYNVDLIGLSFGPNFTTSIQGLGGTALPSTTDPDALVADIVAGIVGGFASYSSVTVGDLGAGLPGIDVSAVCTDAGSGECVGSDAVGVYDRSVDRSFTFDVTFTRLAEGDASFLTHALVDGGIVASEADSFSAVAAPVIPLPAGIWMMMGGLGGLAALRRRKKA